MLAWLERHQLLVLGLAGLVLLTGVGALHLTRPDDPAPIVFRDDAGLAPGSPIRIHVAGAVGAPGVYELRAGDRVLEALTAAGGPIDAADLDGLNLARRLRDEEQVVVPTRAGALKAGATPLPPGAKIDLNTATEAQLDTLPGIGAAYARRIVDSRRVDGPYKSPQDLLDRRVIPRAQYDKVRDLVSVAPP